MPFEIQDLTPSGLLVWLSCAFSTHSANPFVLSFYSFWEAFAGTHMLLIGKLPGEGCDAVDLLRLCRYFTTQDLGSNGRFHDRE